MTQVTPTEMSQKFHTARRPVSVLPTCNQQDHRQRKEKQSSALLCRSDPYLSDIYVILEAKRMVEPVALTLGKCVQRDWKQPKTRNNKSKNSELHCSPKFCACNLAPPLGCRLRQDQFGACPNSLLSTKRAAQRDAARKERGWPRLHVC